MIIERKLEPQSESQIEESPQNYLYHRPPKCIPQCQRTPRMSSSLSYDWCHHFKHDERLSHPIWTLAKARNWESCVTLPPFSRDTASKLHSIHQYQLNRSASHSQSSDIFLSELIIDDNRNGSTHIFLENSSTCLEILKSLESNRLRGTWRTAVALIAPYE